MFTGLITHIGQVLERSEAAGGGRLLIAPDRPIENLAIGESIAVNGVCLTVEPESQAERLRFFCSGETLTRTRLGQLGRGGAVNLERSLRAEDRMGGHLVMGHVDGVGTIRRFERQGDAWLLEVGYPPELDPFLAAKGSVAVDGISLTLASLTPGAFTVAVIPHTVAATTLQGARAGDPVNLEVDMLARYVVRTLEVLNERAGGRLSLGFIEQAGFGRGRAH